MVVIVNPGHVFYGEGDPRNTPGKHSPDKSLREAVWNFEVANEVCKLFAANGITAILAHAVSEKVSLTYPVQVTREAVAKFGASNVLFVSIHVNAAGNGTEWMNAQGWSIYTTPGQNNSDKLATCVWNKAKLYFADRKIRADYQDKDPDYEANFYVIRKAPCPAVLVENFFMDNRDDCEFLKTEICKSTAAKVIVEGVIDYINSK